MLATGQIQHRLVAAVSIGIETYYEMSRGRFVIFKVEVADPDHEMGFRELRRFIQLPYRALEKRDGFTIFLL